MNWDVKFIFTERKSGADANRPEFQKMLSEARQHHFDLLLVWSIDRFSREPVLNTLKYLETLQRSNEQLVKLVTIIQKEEGGTKKLSEGEKDDIFNSIKGK
jgi:site-specific DNA recombinase